MDFYYSNNYKKKYYLIIIKCKKKKKLKGGKSYTFPNWFGYVLRIPTLVKNLTNNYLVKCDPNEEEYKYIGDRTRKINSKTNFGYQFRTNNQTKYVLTKSRKKKVCYKSRNN